MAKETTLFVVFSSPQNYVAYLAIMWHTLIVLDVGMKRPPFAGGAAAKELLNSTNSLTNFKCKESGLIISGTISRSLKPSLHARHEA